MKTRRWKLPVLGGVIATTLGVAINVATELKFNVWAWVAVAVLTVAGIVVGAGSERVTRRRRRAEPTVDNTSTRVTVTGVQNRVNIGIMGPGSVIVLGIIVILAVLAGLLAGVSATGVDARPAAATEPTETAAKKKPFVVTVLDEPTDDVSRAWYGHSAGYLFPAGRVSSLAAPSPENCSDWSTWALGEGGVRVFTTMIAFTVAASGDDAVRVHTVKLHTQRRQGKASGDMVQCYEGGPIPVSYLSIDLDRKRATYQYPDKGPQAGQARPFALEISPGRAEQVEVDASTQNCYCSWYLELLIEVNGTEYPYRIDNSGKPFVTAPKNGNYAPFLYDTESSQWEPGFR